MSHFKKIATWRERIGQTAEFPLHLATDVERAMEAEIAELRTAKSVRSYRSRKRNSTMKTQIAEA